MSSSLKIFLLILFILSFIGSVFWWIKEKGYEPLLAIIASIISIVMWYLDSRNSPATQILTQTNNIKSNINSPIANKIEQQNIYYANPADSTPKDKTKKSESNYSIGDIHGNDNTVIQGDNNKVDKRKITVSKLKPNVKIDRIQINVPIDGKPSPILEDVNYFQTKYKIVINGDDTYNLLTVSAKGDGIRYVDILITSAGMMSGKQMEHIPGNAICLIRPERNEYFIVVYTTKPIESFKGLINIKLDKFDYGVIH